ncbi:tagaturonate reductase [Desulfitibacter alkalitolerans]|uniref:tagaturonate reductase n=1 Tax=Desulfitibacter alkalitolerans TaxID=264641 RepID=UPI000485F1DE|nr:tagaturonate reductase [Desulfitibacter alkalitolerans]
MQPLNMELLKNQQDLLNMNKETKINFKEMPERIIQFGEGNFLRAFTDWMIHRLNCLKLFNGKIVVVQPIEKGMVETLNRQDGLYTIIQRGIQQGREIEKTEIVGSISRGINPYEDWEGVLKCAEDPNIEYVFSNTTEAGIDYDPEDSCQFEPPYSFPGKLTVYLYHRFRHFNGEPSRGMIIIPCELIDKNGDTLKRIVLQLAKNWNYPQNFIEWINNSNKFINSLVDRVVPGYPKEEAALIAEKLGYYDELICTSELYHLWVIEGPEELKNALPFHKANLNVIWTDDMSMYRTRKVRILNGAHTSSVPAAYLCGINTVKEMIEHDVLGKFIKQIIKEEVIPSLDYDSKMLEEYADSVFERFANPYISHYLTSILLNSTSKFKTRVLPSLLDYIKKHGQIPVKLTFSLAALFILYRDTNELQDDPRVLEFFYNVWGEYGKEKNAASLVEKVLANEHIWGQNLNNVDGLNLAVKVQLERILDNGIEETLEGLVKT